ncbi:MAG TPA: [FeFe] hydrogenase H-cluster radical SAM maturase HydE [Firmicutes bacterium]|nr:[FeFe] hydrogenase H-cluster radical SAM maturase HydE [Bacillota bacterium]
MQVSDECEYCELLHDITGRAAALLTGVGLGEKGSRRTGRVRTSDGFAATAIAADPEEIASLLTPPTLAAERALFATANRVRRAAVGDAVHLRAIIEFSNHCERSCWYCGLRRFNRKLPRYRMTVDEVVEAARAAIALGFRTVVLQSGEDSWYDERTICTMVRRIKGIPTPSSPAGQVAITLSLGERPRAEYAAFREAGADRYLLKHETADPDLYRRLHPGMSFTNRKQCLHWLRELGYQVGSGNIVGLPGQTVSTLAADLAFLAELDVEMAGIGPLIVHPETPLGKLAKRNEARRSNANSGYGYGKGSGLTADAMKDARLPADPVTMTLRTVAVTRLLLPLAHLPATSALGTADPQGRQRALQAGANVVMPDLTPPRYRRHYEIYPNKICLFEDPSSCFSCLSRMITGLGRYVATDPGHSPKWPLQGGDDAGQGNPAPALPNPAMTNPPLPSPAMSKGEHSHD